MKNLSNFQIIVLGICVLALLLGMGVFAAFGGFLGGKSLGPVVVWGTLDANTMDTLLTTLRQNDKSFQGVTYVQVDAANYTSALVNAMAAGQGPDLFFISQSDVNSFTDKIIPIPYSVVSQAQFVNSYIDEGNLFLTPQGALALPLTIDPLVMYWNRDIFASAGEPQAPQYWNDLLDLAPKITSLDGRSNVQTSAVALGEWSNITNAKAVLSALFMQAGDSVTARDPNTGALVSVFGQTPQGAPENPATSALRFYTEFANPSKTTYSWNASLPQSQTAFTSSSLGIYFGFASELPSIAARNPNLNFSVALLPQLQGNANHLTYGNMVGVAIARSAQNPQGALAIAQKLTSQASISLLTAAIGLPPVRRDVVVDTSNNAAMSVFVQSSLIARAWLDPSPASTDSVFKSMVDSVVSGAADPSGAVNEAAEEFAGLFSSH